MNKFVPILAVTITALVFLVAGYYTSALSILVGVLFGIIIGTILEEMSRK